MNTTANLVEKVYAIKYHRNGVSGEGFYTIRFEGVDENDDRYQFVAVVHPSVDRDGYETAKFTGYCSVLSLSDDGEPDLFHCWRGDHFEEALRRAIVKKERAEMADLAERSAKRGRR